MFCLICCRGGSKGIPNKNIKKFINKPLLSWTLKHAINSNIFDEIFVSTDSKEIAAVATEHGINVPFLRPKELATDDSDQMLAHNHVFQKLNMTDDSHRVCILNNNPFIGEKIICDSYELAKLVNFEVVTLDCAKVEADYLFYRQYQKIDGLMRVKFKEEHLKAQNNRQLQEVLFSPVNNVVWGKPSYFIDRETYKTKILKEGFNPYILNKTSNFDLDDEEDWEIAEAYMRSILEKKTT